MFYLLGIAWQSRTANPLREPRWKSPQLLQLSRNSMEVAKSKQQAGLNIKSFLTDSGTKVMGT